MNNLVQSITCSNFADGKYSTTKIYKIQNLQDHIQILEHNENPNVSYRERPRSIVQY